MKLSEVFLSFVVSSGIACCLAIAQYIFKSKCDRVECCCIKIHRAVELETVDQTSTMELPQPLQRREPRGPSLDSLVKKG
jgi:hypothetical protein